MSDSEQKQVWNILHVDDDPNTLEMREMMFFGKQIFGKSFNFLKAENIEEAKTILNTTHIHLILMDVVMPEDTHAGLKLVQYIREELKNTHTRIVILTGETFSVNIETMLSAYRCDLILQKTEESAAKGALFFTRIQEQLNEYIAQEREEKKYKKRVYDILHFDDDPIWLEVFKVMCKSEPSLNIKATYSTLTNFSELIEEHHPHVVLMDIKIDGECGGLLAIRQIRERHPKLPIIVFTAQSNTIYLKIAKTLGVKAFLNKKSNEGIRMVGHVYHAIDSPMYAYDMAMSDKLSQLSELSQIIPWKQLIPMVLERTIDWNNMAKLIQYEDSPSTIKENLIQKGYETLVKHNIRFDPTRYH